MWEVNHIKVPTARVNEKIFEQYRQSGAKFIASVGVFFYSSCDIVSVVERWHKAEQTTNHSEFNRYVCPI